MEAVATLRSYLDLCRVSNLPTVWTNVYTACLLAGSPLRAGAYLAAAGALSCFYLAGMVLNDLCDLEYDRVKRPWRPIPSGRVSARHAAILTAILFAAGFGGLAYAPSSEWELPAGVLVAAIALYDFRHKKNPLSVLLMAACRFLLFMVAALAVAGEVPAAVVLAAAVHFFYVLVISAVARYENGCRLPFSVPVVPAMLAGICLVDAVVLAVFAPYPSFLAGVAGFATTAAGQRLMRGD